MCDMQPLNFGKMSIARNERQAVVNRCGCNPDIIFWYRPTLGPQSPLYPAIFTGHFQITADDRPASRNSCTRSIFSARGRI